MLKTRILPLAAAAATLLMSPHAPLRVVRATPVGSTTPITEISVSFDRPIAGAVETAPDPKKVLQLSPELDGRYEWRDPVTVRFIPSKRLPSDLRVVVTVPADFEAMDGSKLAEPYRFAFRVVGPTL